MGFSDPALTEPHGPDRYRLWFLDDRAGRGTGRLSRVGRAARRCVRSRLGRPGQRTGGKRARLRDAGIDPARGNVRGAGECRARAGRRTDGSVDSGDVQPSAAAPGATELHPGRRGAPGSGPDGFRCANLPGGQGRLPGSGADGKPLHRRAAQAGRFSGHLREYNRLVVGPANRSGTDPQLGRSGSWTGRTGSD